MNLIFWKIKLIWRIKDYFKIVDKPTIKEIDEYFKSNSGERASMVFKKYSGEEE